MKTFLLNIVLFVVVVLFPCVGRAQVYEGHWSEAFEFEQRFHPDILLPTTSRSTFDQLPGFPIGRNASAISKSIRNVTLLDVNDDGLEDILFVADNLLIAQAHDQTLWTRNLGSLATYPPSVGDLNGDGLDEIVQITFGVPGNGSLLVLDKTGAIQADFPINYGGPLVGAPALVDLDNDGSLEILFGQIEGSAGLLHVVRADGSPFSAAFPLVLNARPAVTPTAADVDEDGELEIVMFTTTSRYLLELDGTPLPNFPQVTDPLQRYSFNSPLLVDLDQDDDLEIVGVTNGEAPYFFAMHHDGNFVDGWPQSTPNQAWSYNTPTVLTTPEATSILMSGRNGIAPGEVLFNWNGDGILQPGFPAQQRGGCEGYLAAADINDDGVAEYITTSTLLDTLGFGFIHAYDAQGDELNGFPLRPRGWTMLNGASFTDLNGDGVLDMIVQSYSVNFGSAQDSIFIHAYQLPVPHRPERILWNTYRGTNRRNGQVDQMMVATMPQRANRSNLTLYPNPATHTVHLETTIQSEAVNVAIVDLHGRLWNEASLNGSRAVTVTDLPNGIYFIHLYIDERLIARQRLVILR